MVVVLALVGVKPCSDGDCGKGYKKNEPIDVYIDHPSLFITAYRMHCNELEYSNEELANAFHLPQDVIERFFVPAKKYSLRIF